MTEIKLYDDGWKVEIKIESGVRPEVKKKLYDIAEQLLKIIPDKTKTPIK
jgi:antitoxin component of MazEF toxin-antitoxin module